MVVQVFESIWSFESVYELVRYELSPLHSSKWSHHSLHRDPRCATKLSTNQNCICILLSKKQRMYMQIKMAIDHLNLSQQMAGKIFFFFNVQYTYVLS